MNLLSSPRSSQLVRNLGWKCLGILGAIGLSQLTFTPNANAQSAPTSNLSFNDPSPVRITTGTGLPINGIGVGTTSNGTVVGLGSGTVYRLGDVYRFTNVFSGIDALVTIKDAVGGAKLRLLDDNTSPFAARFQPIIEHPGTVNTKAYIQFDVQLVLTGSSTPATAINVYFSAQDIDGGSTTREFVGIKGAQSTVLSNPTTLQTLTQGVTGFVAYEQSSASNAQTGIGIGDEYEFYSFISAAADNFSIIGGSILGSPTCTPATLMSIGFCQRQNSYSFDASDVRRFDFGDAPATYGDALHSVPPTQTVYLGTGVNGDNGPVYNNTDTLDDGIATFPPLSEKTTSYSVTPTCKVNGSFVSGWIDFNRNGTFDTAEKATGTCNGTNVTLSWSGLTGNTAGQSYGRFRISSVAAEVANPSGTAGVGEVEDYPIMIVANADFKLVKRITAINGSTINPNDSTFMTQILDNGATLNDNSTKWPSGYLKGTFETGIVKPGDEIEYTIYYLNAKGADSNNVKICDPIIGNQTYVSGSMRLLPGGASTEIVLTDIVDPTVDRAQTFAAGTIPIKCGLPTNTTTAGVSIEITGTGSNLQPNPTFIPGATGAGSPNTSYGWFRFKTKVKP